MAHDTDTSWQSRLAAWLGMGAAFAAVYFVAGQRGGTALATCKTAYANVLPIYVSVLPMTLAACLFTPQLRRLILAFAGVLVVAGLFFVLLPLRVDRPALIVGWEPLREALLALRSADRDGNAFPSLHVAIATLCTLHLRHPAWWGWLVAVWASTVLTGQHAFVDGAAGLLLALVAHRLARRLAMR